MAALKISTVFYTTAYIFVAVVVLDALGVSSAVPDTRTTPDIAAHLRVYGTATYGQGVCYAGKGKTEYKKGAQLCIKAYNDVWNKVLKRDCAEYDCALRRELETRAPAAKNPSDCTYLGYSDAILSMVDKALQYCSKKCSGVGKKVGESSAQKFCLREQGIIVDTFCIQPPMCNAREAQNCRCAFAQTVIKMCPGSKSSPMYDSTRRVACQQLK